MPFSPSQLAECLSEVGAFIEKRRPPEAIRDKLDFKADIEGTSVVLSEVRPVWNKPAEKRDSPFAKVKWVKAREEWVLYWMRSDLKWHRYEPKASCHSLRAALAEIEADPHGCFFG